MFSPYAQILMKVSDGGTVNLLSRSWGQYNINELGLQKRASGFINESDAGERTYRCASHEMQIFGAIGCGASSIVQRAIHIPAHRILALKKINVFEKARFFCPLNLKTLILVYMNQINR